VLVAAAAAVCLRVLLLLSESVREAVSSRVEVSTPVSAFIRIREGAFLWEQGASPYVGDSLHRPPFVLFFFYPLVAAGDTVCAFALASLDALVAVVLYRVASEYIRSEEARPSCSLRGKLAKYGVEDAERWRVPEGDSMAGEGGDGGGGSSGKDAEWLPDTVALAYLWNPYTILSCVGASTIALDHLAVSLSLLAALTNRPSLSICTLSFASYCSPYNFLLLPAVALILQREGGGGRPAMRIWVTVWSFMATTLLLLLASRIAIGSWDFLGAVYGFVFLVPDLAPNVGLFWYFFMEIFDHFKSFFLFIFQYHIAVYPIPLALRLSHRPVFLAICLLAINAIFKSYPSVGDSGLCLSLGPLLHRQLAGMTHMFYLFQVLLFVSVLSPVFWHLWIVTGSGNANFFYALTVVFAAAQVLLLSESMLAVFRYDRLVRRKAAEGLREGKLAAKEK